MHSARGRRRVWRAARRAAEQARDGDRVEETHCLAEEAKWEKRQTDSALKARYIWCCTCRKTQPLQQQPKQKQQQQQAPCSSSSSIVCTLGLALSCTISALHRCRICCSWSSLLCQWVWRWLLHLVQQYMLSFMRSLMILSSLR